MELRGHPLMSYRGLSNWPPTWTWIFGDENLHVRGEVGILQEVRYSTIAPCRLYLIIGYFGSAYMGCLLFDDDGFCHEVRDLLDQNCGQAIADIGRLEVSHLL
jgi:hypothetical protein